MTAATNNVTNGNGAVKAAKPIDLRKAYGSQYKIGWDEAFFAEHGPRARGDDPWLQVILGRLGHIYPLGGELLAVATNARGPVANHLASLPFCKVILDGDDGITVSFHASNLKAVAKLIRARTTRTLSDAQRAALIAGGAVHRFRRHAKGTNGSIPTNDQ